MQRFRSHTVQSTIIITGVIALLTLGGCATNFDQDYRFAGPEQRPRTVQAILTEPTPPTPSPTTPQIAAPALRQPAVTAIPEAAPAPTAVVDTVSTPDPVSVARETESESRSWGATVLSELWPIAPEGSATGMAMTELTAAAAVVLIDGLGLSPTVRIISIAAVVCLRPLIRRFYNWLTERSEVAVISAPVYAKAAVAPAVPLTSAGPAPRSQRAAVMSDTARPHRVGYCDVY